MALFAHENREIHEIVGEYIYNPRPGGPISGTTYYADAVTLQTAMYYGKIRTSELATNELATNRTEETVFPLPG